MGIGQDEERPQWRVSVGPGSSHHVLNLRTRDQVRLRDSVLSGTEGGAEKGVAPCTLAPWQGREGRRAGRCQP